METPAIGWIAAILVGAIAGWLAEKITRSNMGLITNIVLGVIGAGFGSFRLASFGSKSAAQLGSPISSSVSSAPASSSF